MSFFETHNIYKSFANHKALQDVSISVPEQSVYGLLGPNGAGKTTLIRIINQITAPDSGEVIFNGEPLRKKHIHLIGYLPEERGLYKKMAVGEQALYLTKLKGLKGAEAEKRLKYWFEKFDIIHWWNKKIEELSKGMQQKVQFVVTILHEPRLLIFDEPFTGFDPINTQILKNEILNLRNKGATIIFSTHNMASVEEICDDIALIDKSKKILEGKVHEIRKQFSKNIFEVELLPNYDDVSILSNTFTIIESKHESNQLNLKVQLDRAVHPNDLIKELMSYGQVKGLKECIPGMNDIFIRLVQNNIDLQ